MLKSFKMHDSLRQNIIYLAKREFPDWLNGGRFERLAFDLNYKASNASRRCRELVKDNRLERRENESGCVEYRYIPEKEGIERARKLSEMGVF